MTCECGHAGSDHKPGACFGATLCMCAGYREPPAEAPEKVPREGFGRDGHGRVWKGGGWDYRRSYGGTQKEMIRTYLLMGKSAAEIQGLLHCKMASIRGRRSELRAEGRLP